MKKKKLAEITTGMVLAQPILGPKKVNLMPAGTTITEEHLQKLERWEIDAVYVVDETESLSEDEKIEAEEQKTRKVYQKTYSKAVTCTKNILKNVVNNEPLDIKEVKSSVSEMIEKVIENKNILLQLSWLNVMENHLFSHSVNVCTYALVVGVYLKLSPEQLLELGTTALLHDIGMVKLEESLWNHERSLTSSAWEKIQTHPLAGAEILDKLGKFPKSVLDGVRQHHERRDGSGYPAGLKDEEISYYASIVGVVNIYESLTAIRKYRQRLIPYEAMKIILAQKDKHFLPDVLRAFVAHLAIYPVGSIVLLNSGEIAQVTGVTPDHPFRPRLKVLFDSSRQRQAKAKRLDMLSQRCETKYICKSISESEMSMITGEQ